MISSRNRSGGFFCPVCMGKNLESRGRLAYYDTVCLDCGAAFITDGYTPEEFAEEVELGADNLDWEGLGIDQVMRMAANLDPRVADAFRDHELYLWVDNYFGYIRGISNGNDPHNSEWAEGMYSLIRTVIDDPSDIIDLLSSDEMGYDGWDLCQRLLSINARYNGRPML